MTPTSLVTGCAGFIGSHLSERLLSKGHRVLGLDCFTHYYDRATKERNLSVVRSHPRFSFIEGNILELDWSLLLDGVDYLFHQAAQAGVRSSWGNFFPDYTAHNLNATQVLLEAARSASLRRFVFASTSSIYGDAETYPTTETLAPRPVSPYGVTKLAAERLGQLYYQNFGVPFVALRYFTVYGPRQRPDMGFHKFIRAALAASPVQVYGDGLQTRDFTYVAEVVEANLQAALTHNSVDGEVINIGGGSRVVLKDVLDLIGELTGYPLQRIHIPSQAGDARHTAADITKARRLLGYDPQVSLAEGLKQQVTWLRESTATLVSS